MKNKIVEIFKSKGWGLYKVASENNNNLPKIVANGRVNTLEIGSYYHILPLVSIDYNFDEILDNLEIIAERNQQPRYRKGENTSEIFQLDGFEIFENFINLHPSQNLNLPVEVKFENLVETLNYAISTNNVYYFPSIDELIRVIGTPSQEKPILQGQVRWEYISKENSDQFELFPSEPNFKLFRGQTRRYQPCFPSVSRHISDNSLTLNQTKNDELLILIINLIKAQWFCETLELTPQFKWATEKKMYVNRMALAQHYELPTGYLDLSQSIDVSSFFACCKFENGSWSAMTSGEGIIYMVDLREMHNWTERIKPIGLQIFPRPSEQWGWTFETYLGEDFDSLPYVRKYIFQHNEASSERILKLFDYGKNIFPNDPLFDLAQKIKESQKIPYSTTIKIIEDLIKDEKGLMGHSVEDIQEKLSKHVQIEKEEIEILNDVIKQQFDSNWSLRKDNFFKNISAGFKPLRTPKFDLEK
jgi:FRG domain